MGIQTDLKLHIPFRLAPAGKDYLWGGSRLKKEFGKTGNGLKDLEPLAETWECSTHPDGTSLIADGAFAGRILTDVIADYPEMLGTHPLSLGLPAGQLPILIKFIDAGKDLSVQVHPDDDYAFKFENGSLGKTEMWYVLDAAEDAELIYGFSRDVDKETVRKALESDTVENLLNRVKIQKDDVFYIKSGTVHAIGAGALIVEVQESSNITYRLYDYNRKDKDGKTRPLHIGKALEVADFSSSALPRQPIRVLNYKRGSASELLCRCRYFEVERLIVNTRYSDPAPFHTDTTSFAVLVCMQGSGTAQWESGTSGCEGETLGCQSENAQCKSEPLGCQRESTQLESGELHFNKGDTLFIPAKSRDIRLYGNAQMLRVHC